MDNIYNAKDAALYLGVDQATVRKWAATGKLHGLRLGRAWYFTADAIKDCEPRDTCGRPQVRAPIPLPNEIS
jgi:excisionase family DNA binding protein